MPGNVLSSLDAVEAARMVAAGTAVLVDVREADERAREHIAASAPLPLSRLADGSVALPAGRRPIFLCASGARTHAAQAQLAGIAGGTAYMLKGGMAAWRAADLPVVVDRAAPLPVMRQVQIGAGALVLAGVILALTVSIWFVALSGFVGAGLIVAGVTGFCGMARLLAFAPWNRRAVTQDIAAVHR